jgi:hypothetical protein
LTLISFLLEEESVMRMFVAVVAVVLVGRGVAEAANIALNAPIVNVSSSGSFGPAFLVDNVVDGAGVTTPQLGVSASEGFQDGSYWLNDTTGSEFFILDLGAPAAIGQIRIANTSSGTVNDRRGLTFEVRASNALTGSNLLDAPVTIVTTQSLSIPVSGVITFDVFNPSGASLGNFRYVEYHQLTGGGFGGGLNEFQIIDAVPEPTSLTLSIFVALGLAVFSRRTKA